MTERLYYDQAYLTEFEGTVLACTPGQNGCFNVLLDRSAFILPQADSRTIPACLADSALWMLLCKTMKCGIRSQDRWLWGKACAVQSTGRDVLIICSSMQPIT